MAAADKSKSFYFFDFDDNIMFLETRVLLRNRRDRQSIREVSTHEFASIRGELGKVGEWEEWEQYDETYKHFGDRDPETLEKGQYQYLVKDVMDTIKAAAHGWQAPSWPLLHYACEKQRPTAIVTARGHSANTIKEAIKALVDAGLLPCEPNYLGIYAVNNPAMKVDLAKNLPARAAERFRNGEDVTSDLKRVAINRLVDLAALTFGENEPHRFGMSDDDPNNVDLIVKAMCDSKKRYKHMRFFVIDTHKDEHVKLEVFPAYYPVIGSGLYTEERERLRRG